MPKLIPAEHGTFQRYKQDIRAGVTPCEPCREAGRIHQREWREKRGERVGHRGSDNYSPETIAHGTRRGYLAHLRLDVEPCEPCREAKREYERQVNQNRAEREKAKKRAADATMRVRKPGVVRQKFDQMTAIDYATKTRKMGWAFNCPACGFHSHTYDHRVTAETVKLEHNARNHGGAPAPTTEPGQAAEPRHGQGASRNLAATRVARA